MIVLLFKNQERPRTPAKSRKQGPSHRKIRRWNNDHFESLASEMTRSGYVTAAEVLLRAKEEAHLHRSIYDPSDHQSKQMREYVQICVVPKSRFIH